MDSWKRFDETSLPEKEDFCSNLNMLDVTNADYRHAKRVWKDFGTKILGEYHDLYVQSDNYYFQTYLNIFAKNVLKYMNLIQLTFC